MHHQSVMGIAHELGRSLERVRAGTDRLMSHKLDISPLAWALHVSSFEFYNGRPLPKSATGDGIATPPSLRWSGVPASTRSVAVVCEDPDAPLPEPFVHWMVYGLPSTVQELDGTAATYPEGLNSKLSVGYTPVSPLAGHGEHHYHFQVFALDAPIDLPRGAGRSALIAAMRGHVVAWGDLVGTYEKT